MQKLPAKSLPCLGQECFFSSSFLWPLSDEQEARKKINARLQSAAYKFNTKRQKWRKGPAAFTGSYKCPLARTDIQSRSEQVNKLKEELGTAHQALQTPKSTWEWHALRIYALLLLMSPRKTVINKLCDEEEASKNAGTNEPVLDKMMVSISNAITDRSSVEKSCYVLL